MNFIIRINSTWKIDIKRNMKKKEMCSELKISEIISGMIPLFSNKIYRYRDIKRALNATHHRLTYVSMSLIVAWVRFLVVLPRGKPYETERTKWARKRENSRAGWLRLYRICRRARRNRNNEAIVAVDTYRRYVPEMVVSTEQPQGPSLTLLFLKRRAAAAEVCTYTVLVRSCKEMPCLCVCPCATDISCLHKGTSGISELTLAGEFRSFVYCPALLDRGDKNPSIG